MVAASEAMLEDVSSHVVDQFDTLWRTMEDLELQVHPLEAAHRAHRGVLQRQALMAGVIDSVDHEPFPGFESRACEKDALEEFLVVRNNLVFVLKSVEEFCRSDSCHAYGLSGSVGSRGGTDMGEKVDCGGFVCYNREYHVGGYIQQKLCQYLESKVHEMFSSI